MVTITHEVLDQPINRYILVPGEATLREALLALKTDSEGQEWWVLLVALADGSFLAARFNQFRKRIEAEGAALFDKPLIEVGDPLISIEVVSPDFDLDLARNLAYESDAKLVVVVREGIDSLWDAVLGIVSVGGMRSGADDFSRPSLGDMAGIGEIQTAMRTPAPQEPAPPPRPAAAIPASPPPPAPPMEPEPELADEAEEEPLDGFGVGDDEISVSVDGDVNGKVIVAGDDVNITNVYNAAPEEKTKTQYRRFEAAYPEQVQIGKEEKLYVAVMLPEAPSPFEEEKKDKKQRSESTDKVGIEMPVDHETGELKPVEIEVSVTTTGFKIKGADKKSLTVRPDGETAQRWFLLEPEEVGPQSIMIELTHNGRLLDEIELTSQVFSREKVPPGGLRFSLQVARFNLLFSFAAS